MNRTSDPYFNYPLLDKPVSEYGLTEWTKLAMALCLAGSLVLLSLTVFIALAPVLGVIALVQAWHRL